MEQEHTEIDIRVVIEDYKKSKIALVEVVHNNPEDEDLDSLRLHIKYSCYEYVVAKIEEAWQGPKG